MVAKVAVAREAAREVVATARGVLGLAAVAATAVAMEVAVMVEGREAEARVVARAVARAVV